MTECERRTILLVRVGACEVGRHSPLWKATAAGTIFNSGNSLKIVGGCRRSRPDREGRHGP
eukprot:4408689-Pyramimonas_sp.AAC.1